MRQKDEIRGYCLIFFECDYLRTIAKPRLQFSTVMDAKTGKVRLGLGVAFGTTEVV